MEEKRENSHRRYLWLLLIHDTIVYQHNPIKGVLTINGWWCKNMFSALYKKKWCGTLQCWKVSFRTLRMHEGKERMASNETDSSKEQTRRTNPERDSRVWTIIWQKHKSRNHFDQQIKKCRFQFQYAIFKPSRYFSKTRAALCSD